MSYDALIVAGGHASRLDDTGLPKSLRLLDGMPLMALLLDNLRSAGIDRIAVTTNRSEFVSELECICKESNTVTLRDKGGLSTIEAAKVHAGLMSSRFLFCYGHVVTPVWMIEKAMESGGEFAIGVARSTRRDPIPFGTIFLEPPFLVNRQRVRESSATSWSAYWGACLPSRVGIQPGPGESNTSEEFGRYLTWLRSSRGPS